jgi:hypothetical protein
MGIKGTSTTTQIDSRPKQIPARSEPPGQPYYLGNPSGLNFCYQLLYCLAASEDWCYGIIKTEYLKSTLEI